MANPKVVELLKKRKWKVILYKGYHYVVPKWWTKAEWFNEIDLVERNMDA